MKGIFRVRVLKKKVTKITYHKKERWVDQGRDDRITKCNSLLRIHQNNVPAKINK